MRNYCYALCLSFCVISLFGIAQSGTNVFDESYIHEVRLTFQDTTYWDTLVNDYNAVYGSDPPNFSQRKYVMAETIEVDGVVLDSVGLRLKGLSSNFTSSKRRHFKIDFGEFKDWKLDGVRKINLSNTFSDGTMTKDAIIYHWFRDMGIPAPRTAYYKLYLNNEYWGLYLAIEQVDKNFLEDNFVLSDGNLYKPFFWNELRWHGPNWSFYEDTLELRTNEGTTFHPQLYDFLEFINTASDSELASGIDDVIDFDKYITHSAVDYFVGNTDSPFLLGRNYYLYADAFNGRMTTIPWDYNFSFSVDVDLIYDYPVTTFFDTLPVNALRKRLQENSIMLQMYFDKVCELGQTYNLDYFNSLIDDRIDLIGEQILLEPYPNNWMPFNSTQLLNRVQSLKNFISNNANRISTDLMEYGYSCFLNTEVASEEAVKISPNPTNGDIHLKSLRNIKLVTIVNSLGQTVLTKEFDASNNWNVSINVSALDAGMYFIFVNAQDEQVSLRFEKVD